ncbi:hypothetical protein EDD27_5246 [Nonomuraea polychroma]|uniref:Uncharacterized protein n=1 Tax=Nonomuraea polychroma TaxID=46176 RepID=A0A438MA72_9ACTN|nr:hypothetical protein [Nonomuraea polychroma]RVX42610.1 hypothetical protein EDD27_5246 [Nonomuraea polychroma]
MNVQYSRSTRLCSMGELDPRLQALIRAYAERHLLGDLDGLATICCETRSTPIAATVPRGFMSIFRMAGPEAGDFTTAAVLTGGVIVIATVTEKGTSAQLGARLADVSLELPNPAVFEGTTGVFVQARWFGATEASSYLLPLDAAASGQTFLARLRESVAAARHDDPG